MSRWYDSGVVADAIHRHASATEAVVVVTAVVEMRGKRMVLVKWYVASASGAMGRVLVCLRFWSAVLGEGGAGAGSSNGETSAAVGVAVVDMFKD